MRTAMLLASWVLCTAPVADVARAQAPGAARPAAEGKQVSPEEAQLLNKLHESNLREIAAGELAQKRARTEPVKNYGQLLIKHHKESDRELQALAKRLGVTLTEPKVDLGTLEKTINPANFDRTFADHMAREHREAIAQVQAAQAKGGNAELQALLKKTLPILQQHYDEAVRQVQNNPF